MEFQLAYIDPSSGSVIWQAAVGSILGGAFIVRSSISKFVAQGRAIFDRKGRTTEKSTDSN